MKNSLNKILNKMLSCKLGITLAGLLAFTVPATRADTFGTGANAFTIDFVPIGSPGNAADTTGNPNPAGAVGYNYRMGKYEVSEAIINKFNASQGLTITKDTRGPNKPATSVSWNQAARFVNWLNTSTGGFPAYKFTTGGVNDNIDLWTPADTLDYNPANPFRSLRAKYVLPSADEWYKAAYFNPATNTYSDFPNGLNTAPTAVASGTAANTAVYNQSIAFAGPADITLAGGLSRFGVMGLAGNVWEWDETEWDLVNNDPSSFRGSRGGGWSTPSGGVWLSSSGRSLGIPWPGFDYIGFRVASVATSEVSVSAINPARGSMAGGTSVTITGINFTGVTGVTIGGNAATGVSAVNATTLTAITPPGTVGSASIVVTTPGGTSAANPLFAYFDPNAPPAVSAINPPHGSNAGGTSVTITGMDFNGVTAVTIGGNAATGVNVVNHTTLTAVTPPGTVGSASVVVINPGGPSAANTLYTYYRADTFGTGANTFTIDFVPIGSPGNAADTTGRPNPAGAVGYNYLMGKYEVSEDMINKFNASQGLTITKNTRDTNKPATNVSWNEAARFVNWLNTSTGGFAAYKFTTGGVNDNIALWTPAATLDYDAANPFRSKRAKYVLPSADEWYKAAYFNPDTSTYSDYPNGLNTAPTAEFGGDFGGTTAGTAVYNQALGNGPAEITRAGGLSPFGIMGLGGNVLEWEETAFALTNIDPSSDRGNRGGYFFVPDSSYLSSLVRGFGNPAAGLDYLGFRVASVGGEVRHPVVSAINPASGSPAGGTSVTITGSNFTGATGVTIGGNAATGVSVVNATTLTAITPPGTVGSASVEVTIPGGSSAENTLFTYLDPNTPATVSAINPASGSMAGGTSVTITGSNFTGVTAVTIGGNAAASVSVVNHTTLTAVTPAGTVGSASVVVINPGGPSAANTLYTYDATRADTFGTGANTFTIDFVPIGSHSNAPDTTGRPNPAGAVRYNYRMGKYEVSEAMINKFNASQGLTITKDTRGPNKPATGVPWNQAARFVNWLNTSTGGFPAYKFTTGGVNDNIALWTPFDTLDYDAANPFRSKRANYVLPSADEWYKAAYFNPDTSTYSDYPNGLNTAPTAVESGTTPNTAVYNGQVGPADINQAGGLSPFGIMGLGGNAYEWEETAFELTDIDPSADRGIRGGNWGAPGDAGLSSGTRYRNSPERYYDSAGFRVASVGGEVRAPDVSAINPASDSMAGGTSVTITGSYFTGATAVTIGGNAATDVSVVNATTLTAITPPGTVGSASVVVTTPNGASAANTLFAYFDPNAPPAVSAINPASGSNAGGTSVTITGINFTGATGVTIGGNAATGVRVVNASTLTAITPPGTVGSASVVVTTPNGASAANTWYTYLDIRTDTFGAGANTFTIDFVPIGSPGNAPDTTGRPNPAGAVGYNYLMGKYEVSEAMINKFNASQGLTITKDTRRTNKPATNVSWNEAARFVNWLNTSTGGFAAYKFTTGGVNDNIALWTPADTLDYDDGNPFRSLRASYVLPSADEWYKAAYFNPATSTYSVYPNGLNTPPTKVASGTTPNTAVYDLFAGWAQTVPADITQAGGLSPFGVMGLGGNVAEWNETEFDLVNDSPSSIRQYRGGYWEALVSYLQSSSRESLNPALEDFSTTVGFRVASISQPPVLPFRITSIRYLAGATPSVELTFNSRVGRTFTVEASTAMLPGGQPGGWVELTNSLPAGGTETTYVDTLTTVTGPGVFYRVRENSN